MKYAYGALLRLYPGGYRLMFAQEMTSVFEQAAGDYQPRGFVTYMRFLASEFSGLLTGAFAMWAEEYVERSRRRVSASSPDPAPGGRRDHTGIFRAVSTAA